MASYPYYHVDLVIDNKAVDTQRYGVIRDPGNLTAEVGRVSLGSAHDVDRAAQAAHRAFLLWRRVGVMERIERVLEAAAILKGSIAELAPLLVREHGGLLREAVGDFNKGEGNLNYYSGIIEDFLRAEQIDNDVHWISVEKVPKGVVAAIVPWNMPVVLTMMKLAPALLTGNTLIVKPSPTAPLALSRLLQRMAAVLPDGVLNVINGDKEVGEALVSHPLVKKVAFTGGIETGRTVNLNAASAFKGVTLELGGNDPAIVLDDIKPADIIPELVKGIYPRSGQVCFAVKRIYVPRSMLDPFYNTLCEYVDELKVGHGLDPRSSLGPVHHEGQFKFIQSLISESAVSGAAVRALGTKLEPETWEKGYYILPHVVKEHNPMSRLVLCEQFGPVIPVVPYQTLDQAIGFANQTDYGLCSSVWSGDVSRALGVARQIEAGATFINTHSFVSTTLGMPFGGVKHSGLGREMAAGPTLSAYVDYHSMRYLK